MKMHKKMYFKMNIKMNLLFILGISLLVSCSQTKIIMNKKNMIPYKDFAQKTVISDSFAAIQIVEVIDFRENTQDVGVALTGVQYKDTPVRLSEQFDVFISDYYRGALLDRGLNIVDDGAKYKLTIKVNELWLKEQAQKMPEKVLCKANFTFELSGEKKNFQTNIWNETFSPGDMADGTTKLAPTLASCLNLVAEKLVKSEKFIDFIKE